MGKKVATEGNERRRSSIFSKGSAQNGPAPKLTVNIVGYKQKMGAWSFELSVRDGKKVIHTKLSKTYSNFQELDQILESKYSQFL
jgi:hypothetical protein